MIILRIKDKWVKEFPTYFLILQNVHKLYFDLINCGVDDFEKAEDIVYLLSVQINRILPSAYKKGTNDIFLKKNDGVLLLKDSISFLEEDYTNLFNENKNVISTISDIRNKYEHEPHNIIAICYIISNKEQSFSFLYKKYDRIFLDTYTEEIKQGIKDGIIKLEWKINTTEIGKIILQLNNIFKKIQTKYIEISKDYKDLKNYQIYQKIVNIDFDKINKDILFYIK